MKRIKYQLESNYNGFIVTQDEAYILFTVAPDITHGNSNGYLQVPIAFTDIRAFAQALIEFDDTQRKQRMIVER